MSRHVGVVVDNIQFNINNQTLNIFPVKDCYNKQSAYCVNILSTYLLRYNKLRYKIYTFKKMVEGLSYGNTHNKKL